MANRKAHPSETDAPDPRALESSLVLLERARQGDLPALEALCARYLPRLRRWASGRLPLGARSLSDTEDLVQETVISALGRLEHFQPQHEGALQAYLRQAIVNRIRDEMRRARRLEPYHEVESPAIDPAPTPLEEAIGSDALKRYEGAMARLRPEEREAIHLRIELQLEFREIAQSLNKPSADAARMAVNRALLRLADEMGQARSTEPERGMTREGGAIRDRQTGREAEDA